jgi:hypothetical protein
MRYKDEIQCAGAELVALVREDVWRSAPDFNGVYYALHIRRGDLQFKVSVYSFCFVVKQLKLLFKYQEVKIGAAEMLRNLQFPNGTAIIPRGALVYLSTDDPDGLCTGCLVMRKPCEEYKTPKPVGCPEDVCQFISLKIISTYIIW